MKKTPLSFFMKSMPEDETYSWLEQKYLKEGFYYTNIFPQYRIPGNGIIDYKVIDCNKRDTFIEVKKWEINIEDIKQMIGYYLHTINNCFYNKPRYIIIGKTISDFKKHLLEKIGIEVQFLDEIKMRHYNSVN